MRRGRGRRKMATMFCLGAITLGFHILAAGIFIILMAGTPAGQTATEKIQRTWGIIMATAVENEFFERDGELIDYRDPTLIVNPYSTGFSGVTRCSSARRAALEREFPSDYAAANALRPIGLTNKTPIALTTVGRAPLIPVMTILRSTGLFKAAADDTAISEYPAWIDAGGGEMEQLFPDLSAVRRLVSDNRTGAPTVLMVEPGLTPRIDIRRSSGSRSLDEAARKAVLRAWLTGKSPQGEITVLWERQR